MRTMLQIGLGKTSEGLYLAHPDSDRVMRENMNVYGPGYEDLQPPIPKHWKQDLWRCIGVDPDRWSIGYMTGRYGESDRWQWIHASVHTHTVEDSEDPPVYSLRDLLSHLGIKEHLDVMTMSTSGHEFHVFRSYDFSIRPKCMFIAYHDQRFLGDPDRCHTPEKRQELIDIIDPHGYKVLESGCTDKHLFFVDQHIDEEIIVEREI